MQLMNDACRGALVTCKCPWYILSAQSVADLSVCGCLDLFRTRGAECRTRSRGHGAELAELSSPRVLKPTLSPGFLCAETARRVGPQVNPSATERLHGIRRSVVHHNITAFKVVIVFADVRDSFLPPLLSLRLSFLLSAPPPPPPLPPFCWFQRLAAPRASGCSYSGLLFPVLPTTPSDPALWCLVQC